MAAIFAVTFPFFAIVLLGYVAAARQVMPESVIPGLNTFVLFFALPCMLFRFGASRPFGQLIDVSLIGIYAGCALLMVLCSIAMSLQRTPGGAGVGLKDAAFGALVATFPNAGFMGVPLLVGLLGERAAGPLIGAILVDLVLTSSLCLALAQMAPHAAGAAHDSLAASLGRALRGAASNPLPWAIALGAAVAASGLVLPEPLAQIIKLLGDAATPVALFTIGAVLWRARRHSTTATPLSGYLPLALTKLLVHPLLILSLGVIAAAFGAAVSPFGLLVLILTAALPSASNVSILAERYGADNGRVTRIIMASTALAFISFSIIAWALGADLSR
jgi:malonate transporter and related proteins